MAVRIGPMVRILRFHSAKHRSGRGSIPPRSTEATTINPAVRETEHMSPPEYEAIRKRFFEIVWEHVNDEMAVFRFRPISS